MPDTPDAGTIDPEALKTARKRRNMTQERLAEAVGCTKDTVSRWERGTSRRVRFRLRERLCKALGVKWESLTRPPKKSGKSEDEDVPYHVWIKFLADRDKTTALHLVTLRYGVRQRDVLELAPLLFLIVAERSLLERRRRLDELEAQIEGARQNLPRHLSGIVAARDEHGEDPTEDEGESIEARDIFGLKLRAPFGEEDEWREDANPFVNFVRDLARELPKDAVAHVETYEGAQIDSYRIAVDTLRECTGISEDEEQGRDLLYLIRLGSIDLAVCLRAKRDRDEAGYRQWLSDELARVKREEPLLFLDDDLLFPDNDLGLHDPKPSASEHAAPLERSEQ